MVQQLNADAELAILGQEDGGVGVADGGERRRPCDPSVAATQRRGQVLLERGRGVGPRPERDQIDVLAESTVWQERAGQRGAAEEHHLVAMRLTDRSEDVGDEVVSADLLDRNAELFRDCAGIVEVELGCGHGVRSADQPCARRSDACARCAFASSLQQRRIGAGEQDAYRVADLVLRIAEAGSAGQVEHGLLGRGNQRRTEFGGHAFGIESGGVALDEADLRVAVSQHDHVALGWDGDHRGGDRARDCPMHPSGRDSHQDRGAGPEVRGGDPGCRSLEGGPPVGADMFLRHHDVVAVRRGTNRPEGWAAPRRTTFRALAAHLAARLCVDPGRPAAAQPGDVELPCRPLVNSLEPF